jgi:hypothetical protein
MTVETKCFVTLDDIRGFHIQCKGKGCGLKLTVNIQDAATKRMRLCPACNAIWMEEDSPQQTAFMDLAEAMSTARNVIGSSNFVASLEIPCPEIKK